MGDDQDMKRCLAILLCLSFFLSLGQIAFSEGNGITGDFAAVGSVVTFGRYEQDNDLSNGPEPIEWTVLDVRDGKSLLISRFGLECRPFNDTNARVTWDRCTLRNWLNGTFFENAFHAEEQAQILTTSVSAEDAKNPKYDVKPGDSTEDKIFLLSIHEANSYFASDEERKCFPTAFAASQLCIISEEGHCWWWLRSPGSDSLSTALVDFFGFPDTYGYPVFYEFYAIRPVLWVDLSAIDA